MKKIGVERENAFGLGEPINRLHVGSEGSLRSGERRLVRNRLVFGPNGLRQRQTKFFENSRTSRRRRLVGQESEASPLGRGMILAHIRQKLIDGSSREHGGALGVSRSPIGIVKIEDRSLSEQRTGAAVRKVAGVTFELRGAPLMRLSEQRDRRFAQRHRGREILRQTGNNTFNRFAEGQNIQLGTTAPREADASEGERRRHDLHEVTAIDAVQLRSSLRKFTFQLVHEPRCSGKLIEAAPVLRTVQLTFRRSGMFKYTFHQRWQPEQLWGGFTFQLSTSAFACFTPASPWSTRRFESRLKTSFGSRRAASGLR